MLRIRATPALWLSPRWWRSAANLRSACRSPSWAYLHGRSYKQPSRHKAKDPWAKGARQFVLGIACWWIGLSRPLCTNPRTWRECTQMPADSLCKATSRWHLTSWEQLRLATAYASTVLRGQTSACVGTHTDYRLIDLLFLSAPALFEADYNVIGGFFDNHFELRSHRTPGHGRVPFKPAFPQFALLRKRELERL